MNKKPYRIFIAAAENSGDQLGARLIRALKQVLGNQCLFFGVGGERMAEEGINSPVDITDLSVFGAIEALFAYKRVMKAVDLTIEHAVSVKADLVILIDSWGYTLRVAKGLKKRNPCLPIIKYVGPQVWASRPKRAYTLAHYVDYLMSIHSFDAPYFEKAGLETFFVGNSTLSVKRPDFDKQEFRKKLGIGLKDPVLVLLIGSRPSEAKYLYRVLDRSIYDLKKKIKNLKVISPIAYTIRPEIETVIERQFFKEVIWLEEELKYHAFEISDLALACSGTVVTELSMFYLPSIVVYRVHPVTAFLIRMVIKTRYISLVNIAMQEEIIPELVQENCQPELIVSELEKLYKDPILYRATQEKLTRSIEQMRGGIEDSALRAAKTILLILKRVLP